jgi:hypothetical protein
MFPRGALILPQPDRVSQFPLEIRVFR